jgi:hypothetical protein
MKILKFESRARDPDYAGEREHRLVLLSVSLHDSIFEIFDVKQGRM